MLNRASFASAIAMTLLATPLWAAQADPNALAVQLKQALESCGEFHGNTITVNDFFRETRRRESYRYAEVAFQGNVMNWVKYIANRTEGNSEPTGSGHLYFYSVRLSDLTPDSLVTFERKLDNHNTGIFLTDLACQGGSTCITQTVHEIHPPSNTAQGVAAPLDRWTQSASTLHHVQRVNMHMCGGNGMSSKDQADLLRVVVRGLITASLGGMALNVPANLPPGAVPYGAAPYSTGPSTYAPPTPYGPSPYPPQYPAVQYPTQYPAQYPATAPAPQYPGAAPPQYPRAPAAPYPGALPGQSVPLQYGPTQGSTRAPLF